MLGYNVGLAGFVGIFGCMARYFHLRRRGLEMYTVALALCPSPNLFSGEARAQIIQLALSFALRDIPLEISISTPGNSYSKLGRFQIEYF